MDVIYQDGDYVVVSKPAGVVVHRTGRCADDQSCLTIVRNQLGRWVYPVHRLDRATSGVLAFGLTSEAAAALAGAFERREVVKTYLAVVRGLAPDAGMIDRPLANHDTGVVQTAVTRFRTLAQVELAWAVGRYGTARYSLVELTPETGRTHQLRRHLAGLNHPVIGDTRYGDGAHNVSMGGHLGGRRLLLHAAALTVPLPLGQDGAVLTLTAPLDTLMAAAARLFPLPPGPMAGKLTASATPREEASPCSTKPFSNSPRL